LAYQIVSEGVVLDAQIEIDGSDIRLFSRSGRSGTPSARNSDYAPGLRAVLDQLKAANIAVEEAFVDSGRVQTLPLADRRILSSDDQGAAPDEQFRLLSQRMRQIGRTSDRPGGNNNKLVRLRTSADTQTLKSSLDLAPSTLNARSLNRIPDSQLAAVRPHHIWSAIEALRFLTSWSPYHPSTDYDVLLEDGVRLPPKAVFGRAASEALGVEVLPRHFSGGVGTLAFESIRSAGYAIVAKDALALTSEVPLTDDDVWAEGAPKLRSHMRRERARGLSKAKKSAFIEANDGRLFCERCLIEPTVAFEDPLADACIEVHHRETAIAAMVDGHVTKLSDLECLCANCHRLVHARLRAAEKSAFKPDPPI